MEEGKRPPRLKTGVGIDQKHARSKMSIVSILYRYIDIYYSSTPYIL